MNANRRHMPVSAALLSPLLLFFLASGLAAAASSRIMMPLSSAPPLEGSVVAMVGPPWKRRRGRAEEAFCSLLKAEQRAPRSQMTPPVSLNALERWTLVLFSHQCA